MTAYEAFGRVVADRDRLADIELTWPAGTVHSPEQLARMRESCADIRTALEAVGDPSVHPLQGIEQTRWNPAWAQALQQAIDRLQATLQQTREAADALVTSLGLNEVADDSSLPQLVKLVALMLNPDAADGVLLLNEDASDRIRALTALADVVGRIRDKASELSAEYDLKAALLDLPALQRDWTEACASNLLVRSGRKKKVRLHLQPYCHRRGARRDRPRPHRPARPMPICFAEWKRSGRISGASNGCGGGLDSDPARIAALIKWAHDLQAAVDAFQIDDVPPERITRPRRRAPRPRHLALSVRRPSAQGVRRHAAGLPGYVSGSQGRRCLHWPRSSGRDHSA